jgi:hypothetical protein
MGMTISCIGVSSSWGDPCHPPDSSIVGLALTLERSVVNTAHAYNETKTYDGQASESFLG